MFSVRPVVQTNIPLLPVVKKFRSLYRRTTRGRGRDYRGNSSQRPGQGKGPQNSYRKNNPAQQNKRTGGSRQTSEVSHSQGQLWDRSQLKRPETLDRSSLFRNVYLDELHQWRNRLRRPVWAVDRVSSGLQPRFQSRSWLFWITFLLTGR